MYKYDKWTLQRGIPHFYKFYQQSKLCGSSFNFCILNEVTTSYCQDDNIFAFLFAMITKLTLAFCLFLLVTPQPIRAQIETTLSVGQSQSNSYQSFELRSLDDMEYRANIQIGTPPQSLVMLLDTGSNEVVIPVEECFDCQTFLTKFKTDESSSFIGFDREGSIKYMKGQVKGYYGQENITLGKLTYRTQILFVNQTIEKSIKKSDGIIGIGSSIFSNNIFDSAFEEKQLKSAVFAFQLGRKQFQQKSYLYYNISKDDFPTATYIPVLSIPYYWVIYTYSVSLRFDNKYQQIENKRIMTVVDTGTSWIVFSETLFKKMKKKYFGDLCPFQFKTSSEQFYLCECDISKYPDLIFSIGDSQIVITPDMYIMDKVGSTFCQLLISSAKQQQVILGDIFFQRYTTIFDKNNRKVGIVDNYRPANRLFPSYMYMNVLKFLFIFKIFAGIATFFGDRSKRIEFRANRNQQLSSMSKI